jgi:hypothetical protein
MTETRFLHPSHLQQSGQIVPLTFAATFKRTVSQNLLYVLLLIFKYKLSFIAQVPLSSQPHKIGYFSQYKMHKVPKPIFLFWENFKHA